jgi:hypothetical protein
MGTRIDSSPRFPSTWSQLWSTAYGQLSDILHALLRGDISEQQALEVLDDHLQDLARMKDQLVEEQTAAHAAQWRHG